jgi:ligand-binding sensor domain-containing protein
MGKIMKPQKVISSLLASFCLGCIPELAFPQNSVWQPTNGPWTGSFNSFVIDIHHDIFIHDGAAIYRSTDYGATWKLVRGGFYAINTLALHRDAEFWVGLSGSDGGGGLWRYRDNGESWIEVYRDLLHTEVVRIFSSPFGHLYVNTLDHGVFRSTDEGGTWTPIMAGMSSPGVLAIAPNGRLFAQTNDGVLRSSDHGNTWRLLTLKAFGLHTLAINSAGHIFVSAFQCIYRSMDNGRRWQEIAAGMPPTSVRALVFNFNGHLLAGTRHGGIYLSTDNGEHWKPSNAGSTAMDIRVLAVNARGHVFAGTQDQGILRSLDQGNSWSPANSGLADKTVYALATDANGHLFAGTRNGVVRSTDDGDTWQSISIGQVDHLVYCFALNSKNHIFAGTVAGVYRSVDNGDHWKKMGGGMPDSSVSALAIAADGYLFAGTPFGVFRSIQAVDESFAEAPQKFHLAQNYPNPFNASTTIRFSLPQREHVILRVFDVQGREVETLVNRQLDAGNHTATFTPPSAASGLYFYTITAGKFKQTCKAILLK